MWSRTQIICFGLCCMWHKDVVFFRGAIVNKGVLRLVALYLFIYFFNVSAHLSFIEVFKDV